MGQILHGNARTTAAGRRAIQQNQASLNRLATIRTNPRLARRRRDGFIYAVFPRDFSFAGDLKSVTAKLDQLKDLGSHRGLRQPSAAWPRKAGGGKADEGCRSPRRWRAIRFTQARLEAMVFSENAPLIQIAGETWCVGRTGETFVRRSLPKATIAIRLTTTARTECCALPNARCSSGIRYEFPVLPAARNQLILITMAVGSIMKYTPTNAETARIGC